MVRLLLILLGVALMLFGVVLWILPIPFGLIVMGLALMILVAVSPRVARGVSHARRRSRRADRVLDGLTHRAPMPYRRVLRRTEPLRWR